LGDVVCDVNFAHQDIFDTFENEAGISMLPKTDSYIKAALVAVLLPFALSFSSAAGAPVYIRHNLLGYLPEEGKVAIAFSEAAVRGGFELVEEGSGRVVFSGRLSPSPAKGWGRFSYYYDLDFSPYTVPGRYYLRLPGLDSRSNAFRIGLQAYGQPQEDALAFMRQQRCGYNPFLDRVCHQRDGRSFYGPMPDSTYVDLSGGWHDAGDQLKYLLTSSNATARLIHAYLLEPGKFSDHYNALGQEGANGIADVLDEARWGLDWIHKMHPAPGQLFHQVADDRDHRGWKWPDQDPSDYGWGANSYRAAYFADGRPQGLQAYKSQATGIANLAGRSAAAMALGYRVWKEQLRDDAYAARCLKAARELYEMGRQQEGYQQGNSYGAPYRYTEDTWADDMEWGAAELYAATGETHYLDEARQYARQAAAVSWMPYDTADHYRYYPFVNAGHFALFPHVDKAFQDTLAGYYREGITHCLKRAGGNPFQVGVPFIWCSNNLACALATQILFYEKMTNDRQFHGLLLAQCDWLLGRNPWGTSMFTGIPADGEYPLDVHTSVYVKTGQVAPGGLVDGPVYKKVHDKQLGIVLAHPDEFAHLQNSYLVYQDDIGDYATNEPTMDGTADAVYWLAAFAR
ncbi:MAG: glycoside hydrolase family 9 protein, partial [Phaeodactylibacter sp.]|nr:glycoside hydrolase family 9 protein [Phaeodactylibacter sp.]